MNESELLLTPKRKTEVWGYLDDNCIEISWRKTTFQLDPFESFIWECCNGYIAVGGIIQRLLKSGTINSTFEDAEARIIKLLKSWKKEGFLILDFNFIHSASEYDDSCIYKIEANVSHPVDILLISAPSPSPMSHMVQAKSIEPLGIGYLSSFLKSHGFNAGIMNLWDKRLNASTIKDFIMRYNPQIVGISSMTENFENGIRIAKITKELREDIIIIFGGSHVTFDDENTLLNHKSIDIIVRGEGEYTLLELANYYLCNEGNISSISGISYRKNKSVVRTKDRMLISDLDALPFPDRMKLESNSTVGVQTSRGCPSQCIFCAARGISGGKYRKRSAENVISEVEYLLKHGINRIFFQDDTLTIDIARLNRILDLIEEKELFFNWTAESRVDAIEKDPHIIRRMANNGCVALQLGIESGSQAVLNALKKNITIEQISNAISIILKEGIECKCSFLIGHPFETHETMLETLELAKRLIDLGVMPVLSAVCPFPGTSIFQNSEFYNITINDNNYSNYNVLSPVIEIKALATKDIKKFHYKYLMELERYYGQHVEHSTKVH